MPKLSDTMTEGTLLRWCKKKGDKIEIGDILAEVETDKATMEMEAFEEGILADIFVEEGGRVLVGAALGVILGDGEKLGERKVAEPAAPIADASPSSTVVSSGRPLTPRARAAAARAGAAPGTPEVRVKSSPLARKIAASRGVNLATIKGTGPGGRVIAYDVENAPIGGAATAIVTSSSPVAAILPTPIAGMSESRIPLSGMRRVIAERLLASKTQIPHFYLCIEINAAPMMAFRKEFNEAGAATGTKITFNDIALSAVARAAMKKPKVNASFAGDSIVQYGSVNLSVAIAVEDGLVTPVIRNAETLSLAQISSAVKDLASRARDKKLKPDEYAGGTITVSNLGSYGIEQFCAIVNPPQAAILAIGAIIKKPIVNGDEIEIGNRMSITLSGDHRVVDGAVAAEYMSELRKLLEAPALLLL